jgi:hypothetical protein
MNEMKNNVVGLTPPAANKGQMRTFGAQSAINAIQSSIPKLIREDVRAYWDDAGEQKLQGITYGAYNQISYRAKDGSVMHACGQAIDEMRATRQFTHNAIELRCDALGLAIYISGVNQIDIKTNQVRSYLRVATYQYQSKTPDLTIADTALDLYKRVHTILVSTYNHLAREYCIAGLTAEDLTLRSNSTLMPDVAINQPC